MCSQKYRDWKKRSPKKNIKRRATTISSLHSNIELPKGWYDHTPSNLAIRLCKVSDTSSSSAQPLVITHSIIVNSNYSWKLFVHNRAVSKCSALTGIPSKETSLLRQITLVDKLHVCSGHPESKFVNYVDSRKGKLHNKSGGIAAFVDEYAPILLHGETFQTVRTSGCEMLVRSDKCSTCSSCVMKVSFTIQSTPLWMSLSTF